MDAKKIKSLIPLYLEGELQPAEMKIVKDELAKDPDLRKYAQLLQKSWDILDEAQEIQPSPDYLSRFWTRVSLEQLWYEKVGLFLQKIFLPKRLTVALATYSLLFVLGFSVFQYFQEIRITNQVLASLNEDELQMVEDIELAENLDAIEEMDILNDWELIEELEIGQT